MLWLGEHPELQCPQEENYSLMSNNPGQLVQDMYAQAPYDNFKRGYKNPVDLFHLGSSMKLLDQYFPKTKLIITLRHPVRYVSGDDRLCYGTSFEFRREQAYTVCYTVCCVTV